MVVEAEDARQVTVDRRRAKGAAAVRQHDHVVRRGAQPAHEPGHVLGARLVPVHRGVLEELEPQPQADRSSAPFRPAVHSVRAAAGTRRPWAVRSAGSPGPGRRRRCSARARRWTRSRSRGPRRKPAQRAGAHQARATHAPSAWCGGDHASRGQAEASRSGPGLGYRAVRRARRGRLRRCGARARRSRRGCGCR